MIRQAALNGFTASEQVLSKVNSQTYDGLTLKSVVVQFLVTLNNISTNSQ